MDRAEQAWVDYEYREHPKGLYYTCFVDGYRQAEKDLALTLEDVKAIVTIADSMLTHTAWDAIDWPDEQKYYEEVLRRFNEQKKK